MAVFRVEKTKDYTVMSNYHLQDPNISLKAKGLLSYLLSLPDNWQYTVAGIASQCKEGKEAIRNALQELEEARYMVRRQLHNKDGSFGGNEYVIYEVPVDDSPLSGNPSTVNPSTGNPLTENPTEQNTNIQNTKYYIYPPISPQEGDGCGEVKPAPKPERRHKQEEHYKPVAFESLYDYYPRHVGKQAAQKAWDKLRPSPEVMEAICNALRMQKAYWLAIQLPKDKIPHLATWLNGRRWEDDPDEFVPDRGGGQSCGGWAEDPEVM